MRWNIQKKQHGLDNKFNFYDLKANSMDEVIGSSFLSVIQISDGTIHFISISLTIISKSKCSFVVRHDYG